MSDQILSRKYIDISITPTGDASSEIDFVQNYPSPIIDDQSQYDLTIIRFKLPSSGIPKFLFKTGVLAHVLYMKYGTTVTPSAIPSDDSFEFDSPSEFLDVVNRSLMYCYFAFYRALHPGFISDTPTSINLTNGAPTATLNSGSGNILIATATQAVYTQLTISNVTYSTAAANFKLTLTVGGRSAIIFQNYSIADLQTSGLNFHDGGSFHSQDRTGASHWPVEPFSKLNYVGSGAGTWQLTLEADDIFNVSMTAQLTMVYADPDVITPLHAPFFSIDTNSYINLNYSPLWYKSGYQLGMNPQMQALFNYFTYIGAAPIQYMTLPQQIATSSATEDDSKCSIELRQMNSTLFLFNQIDRIEFTTQISVESEIGKTAGSYVSVLTDFCPDPALPLDYFIFNASNTYRRYKLLSSGPLSRVTLTAWVIYTDGTRRRMIVQPHESANIKIMLIPSNLS